MMEEAVNNHASAFGDSSSSSSNGGLSSLLLHYHAIRTPLSPITNNVASALLTIIYVKTVMEIGAVIRVKYGVPEFSRKFVHFCACSFVIFWPLFDSSHWGWRLNVTVPAVMSLRLLYKGAILKDPEDEDVILLSRSSSPSELLYGPLQMTSIMCYVGLTQFMTPTGIVIMASLVGDGMAAMIGIQYGNHKYKVPLGGEKQKSIEGSIGCVIGTMGGIWLFAYMCGMMTEVAGWKMLLAYGCISALMEATALFNWDNFLLAVAMQISAKHLPNII